MITKEYCELVKAYECGQASAYHERQRISKAIWTYRLMLLQHKLLTASQTSAEDKKQALDYASK